MGAAHTIHTQCQYYLLLLYTSTIPCIALPLIHLLLWHTLNYTTDHQCTINIHYYNISNTLFIRFHYTIWSCSYYNETYSPTLLLLVASSGIKQKNKKSQNFPKSTCFDSEGHPYMSPTSILTTLGGFASPTHTSLGSCTQYSSYILFCNYQRSFYNSFKLDNKNMSKGYYTRVEQQTTTQPFILYM